MAYYVSFESQEVFAKFEQEIEIKIGRSTTIGTREYLLDKARREGQEQDLAAIRIKKLEAIAKAEKLESASKMLKVVLM